MHLKFAIDPAETQLQHVSRVLWERIIIFIIRLLRLLSRVDHLYVIFGGVNNEIRFRLNRNRAMCFLSFRTCVVDQCIDVETILQVHQSFGELQRSDTGVGRRLAQLSSRFPVGLQDGRVGKLFGQFHDRFHRLLREGWLGVRLENGVARYD